MNETLWHLLLILIGMAWSFPLGMIFGAYREKQWQIEKRRMNNKIRHAKREVDKLCNEYVTRKEAGHEITQYL